MNRTSKIIKIACFWICLLCLVICTYKIFRYKSNMGVQQLDAFYEQPADTIDVIFVGNSHVYMNVDTSVLWSTYGVAAYDLSTSGQPIWNSYHMIIEALKTQTPKLIVIEAQSAMYEENYAVDLVTGSANFGLKFSDNAVQSVQASTDRDKWLDYVLKYPFYHLRYTDIKRDDFVESWKTSEQQKGYVPLFVNTEFEEISLIEDDGREELLPKCEEYIQKILNLADEKDIPVLFVMAPFYGYSTYSKRLSNSLLDVLNKENVPYVDCNNYIAEIGLNSKTDFAETSHLNYKGAEKYSGFLGEYITENYDIPDRRGDDRYNSWNENYNMLQREKRNFELALINEKEEYFDKLYGLPDDYEIIVTVTGNISEEYVKTVVPEYQGADSMWFIKGGSTWEYEEDQYHNTLGYDDINLFYDTKLRRYKFYLNEDEYDHVVKGINVYVYDKINGCLVDTVGFIDDNTYR